MNGHLLAHPTLRIPHRLALLCWLSLLAFFGAGLGARAAVIIDLPELTLLPNQANQVFTISVQNDGASVFLTGVQLELILGDGDIVIGGSGGAPAFEEVSLLAAGSLFAGNNTGDRGAGNFAAAFPPDGLQQMFQRLTSTASGTVTLGIGTFDLATVIFDTTGIDPGDYSWSAATAPNGISYFTDTVGQLFPTLHDGTLTVAPEPVNVALAIFGGLAALVGGVRRWCRQETIACPGQQLAP